MKVLFFIYAVNGGGAERVTATLASHWVRKGWDVTLVSLVSSGADAYELDPAVRRIVLNMGAESGNLFSAIAQNMRRIEALRNVLRDERPDVALAMESRANILLPLAARGMHDIVLIGSERTFPPRSPLSSVWQELRRRVYGRLDAVVALTSECSLWLTQHTAASNVHVIPNPAGWPLAVHTPRVDPVTLCAPQRKIVLAAGRLIPEKNVGVLIDAFAAIAKQRGDWDLVIVGEGMLRKVLEEQVKAAGLMHRVFFAGRVGNLGDWYENADLYVMTSEFEGFPNTLAEAMAHGLPAVSYDCETGPRDIIRHGIDGFLVRPGDISALKNAMGELMDDADLRHGFARQAVEVRSRFSLEKVSSIWEQLFEECKRKKRHTALRQSSDPELVQGAVHESRIK